MAAVLFRPIVNMQEMKLPILSTFIYRYYGSQQFSKSLPNIFYHPSSDYIDKNALKKPDSSILRNHPNVKLIDSSKNEILTPLSSSSSSNDSFFVGPLHTKRHIRRSARIADGLLNKNEVEMTSDYEFRSPKRLTLVANQVKGLTLDEAILQMKFSPKRAAIRVHDLLLRMKQKAAVENLDVSNMIIDYASVVKGRTIFKLDIKGRGKCGKKRKMESRVTFRLREPNYEKIYREKYQSSIKHILRHPENPKVPFDMKL